MSLEGTVQKFKLYPKQRGSLLRADVFSDTAKEAMQGQYPASDLHFFAASFDQNDINAMRFNFSSQMSNPTGRLLIVEIWA
ncbi:hypothetical protein VU08_07495 [Desulfobulbus sp. F5]|nr:hypothetical protein [Desulfobulbus sp. F5]